MKSLPAGNFALSIAHPGHEIRLHGFIEQTKPFIFILADQGDPSQMKAMSNYLGFIYKNTKVLKRDGFYIIKHLPENGVVDPEKNYYLKDIEVQTAIHENNMPLFEYYTKKMANIFIGNDINYVIVDSSEELDAAHDLNRAMTDAAVKLVKKVKNHDIEVYEFNVLKPFNHNISQECIVVYLTKEEQLRKLKHIISYHPNIFNELNQNLPVDIEILNKLSDQKNGFEEIKNILPAINPDFFKYEYLRPASPPPDTADYNNFILPIREKLMEL